MIISKHPCFGSGISPLQYPLAIELPVDDEQKHSKAIPFYQLQTKGLDEGPKMGDSRRNGNPCSNLPTDEINTGQLLYLTQIAISHGHNDLSTYETQN